MPFSGKSDSTPPLPVTGTMFWYLRSGCPFYIALLLSSIREFLLFRKAEFNIMPVHQNLVMLVVAVGHRFWQLPLSVLSQLVLVAACVRQTPWLVGAAAAISLTEALFEQCFRKKWTDPKYLDSWFANFEHSQKNLSLQIKAKGGMCQLVLYWFQATLRDLGQMRSAWTYGEITAGGISTLCSNAVEWRRRKDMEPVRCFLDLGGGHGRAVLSAAVLFPSLEHAISVELSEIRHQEAVRNHRELSGWLHQVNLRERVFLMRGDMLCAVVGVAAADVIWVHNTCFKHLNDQLVELIDDYAREGTMLYSITEFPIARRLVSIKRVAVKLSYWFRRNVYCAEVVGKPVFGPVSVTSNHVSLAFERWAPTGRLLEEEHVRAAIESVMLGVVTAEDLLEKRGVRELSSRAFSESCGGVDLTAFEDLCRESEVLVNKPNCKTPARVAEKLEKIRTKLHTKRPQTAMSGQRKTFRNTNL